MVRARTYHNTSVDTQVSRRHGPKAGAKQKIEDLGELFSKVSDRCDRYSFPIGLHMQACSSWSRTLLRLAAS